MKNNKKKSIITKILLEVAVNTPNSIPLEFFKNIHNIFPKNPQTMQKINSNIFNNILLLVIYCCSMFTPLYKRLILYFLNVR